jgi:hypothetical protein
MVQPSLGDRWVALLSYLGMAMYGMGAVLLGVTAWQRRDRRNGTASMLLSRAPSALLMAVLLVLPIVSALPLLYNLRSIPIGWPLGLSVLNDLPRGWIYASGAVWLLLGGWLASRRVERRTTV